MPRFKADAEHSGAAPKRIGLWHYFVAVSESRVELGALFLKQAGISGFKRGAKVCSLIEATHAHVVRAGAVKSWNVSQDIGSHNNLGDRKSTRLNSSHGYI